jgi:hypothetical protein
MGLIATISTIPERRETFLHVLDAILSRQSHAVDHVHVFLDRYGGVNPSLPADDRVTYHLGGGGPWVRYLPANDLADDDILLTLDDDMVYPPDYVGCGVAALSAAGDGWAVSFGGILWDPIGSPHTYTENSWRLIASRAQDRDRTVAFPMGAISFFRARDVKGIVQLRVPGFKTNDDMMVALGLQQRGVAISSLSRPAGWIRDLPTASAEHALYRRDVGTRYQVFREMVDRLGFDPTAGELGRYLEMPRRILVLADSAPPLPGAGGLDAALRGLCEPGAGVHLLAPVPASKIPDVMFSVNAPYEVHAVAVPEPGGRLDSFPPVRAWRNWRVARGSSEKWTFRERLARERLQPTEVYRYRRGRLEREGAA